MCIIADIMGVLNDMPQTLEIRTLHHELGVMVDSVNSAEDEHAIYILFSSLLYTDIQKSTNLQTAKTFTEGMVDRILNNRFNNHMYVHEIIACETDRLAAITARHSGDCPDDNNDANMSGE